MRSTSATITVWGILVIILICLEANTVMAEDRSKDLENARILKKSGQFEKATELLIDVANTDPSTAPNALNLLAYFYRENRQFEKAIEYYQQALAKQQGEDCVGTYYWLGMTYDDAQKPDKAIETYKAVLDKFPNHPLSPDITLKLAEQYHFKGQCDLAVEIYTKVAKDHPDQLVKAHYLIGMCHKNRKRYSEAIEAFKKGITDAPSSVAADDPWLNGVKYQIVECYEMSCEWDAGITDLNNLAQQFPKDAVIYLMGVGSCYVGQYDYDKAISIYTNMADKYSGDIRTADVLMRLTDLLENQERYNDKLECLNRICKEHPTYWRINDVHFEYAKTLKLQKKYDDAVAAFQKIAESQPSEHTRVWFQIGLLYRDQKMFDKAIEKYKEGIEKVPVFVPKDDLWLKELKIQIAECYAEKKDYKNAQSQYKILASEYPNDPGLAVQVAACVSQTDQSDDPLTQLDQALDSTTDSASLHSTYFQIAERLWRNGQAEKAITLLDDIATKKPSFKGFSLIVKAELFTYNLNKHTEAIAIARQLLKEGTPDPIGTKVVLINALQNNGQTHEAIAAIEELLKEDVSLNDKAIWVLRIGDIHFTAREYGKASTAYQRVCKIKHVSSITSSNAMYYLAICYRQTGYDRIARQCMNRVAKLYPDSSWAEESIKTIKGWDFVDEHPSLRYGR